MWFNFRSASGKAQAPVYCRRKTPSSLTRWFKLAPLFILNLPHSAVTLKRMALWEVCTPSMPYITKKKKKKKNTLSLIYLVFNYVLNEVVISSFNKIVILAYIRVYMTHRSWARKGSGLFWVFMGVGGAWPLYYTYMNLGERLESFRQSNCKRTLVVVVVFLDNVLDLVRD